MFLTTGMILVTNTLKTGLKFNSFKSLVTQTYREY